MQNETNNEDNSLENTPLILINYNKKRYVEVKWKCCKCQALNCEVVSTMPLKACSCGYEIQYTSLSATIDKSLRDGIQNRYYSTKAVGVTFCNEDNLNRQVLIHYMPKTSVLSLVPEPDNIYDPKAIAVYSEDKRLGYLPRNYVEDNSIENIDRLFVLYWERTGAEEKMNYGLILDLAELAPENRYRS